MTKPNKIIGILGGMGPAATATFFSDVVAISQNQYHAEQDTDYPTMYLYNAPLDGFNETGFENPESVARQLVEDVRKIESWGADFIVIPCNTVHHFTSEMQAAISIPIVSIVEATVREVQKAGFRKVGVVSSTSTRSLKLYENALSASGVEIVHSTDAEQKSLDGVILAVMAGKQGDYEKDRMRSVIERMASEGAEGVVLGCTELPLAICQADTSVSLFNTIHILAEAAAQEAYS